MVASGYAPAVSRYDSGAARGVTFVTVGIQGFNYTAEQKDPNLCGCGSKGGRYSSLESLESFQMSELSQMFLEISAY